jgi:hypothetical protein
MSVLEVIMAIEVVVESVEAGAVTREHGSHLISKILQQNAVELQPIERL